MFRWNYAVLAVVCLTHFGVLAALGGLGGQADLVIDQISHAPDKAVTGTPVVFTVTIKNQGSASTLLPFSVSFWSNLASAPSANTAAQQTQAATLLAAGASVQLTFTAIAPGAGDYSAWAYADQSGLIAESDKTNNAGPLPAGHAWSATSSTLSPPTTNPTGAAPTITSALTATGTTSSAFSYKITATGATPVTFNAVNLPPGLSFSVDTIFGTPATAGAFTIAISATNIYGGDARTLNLSVQKLETNGAPSGGNTSPQFASLPTITPNPPVAGQPVQFSAAATDADGDALVYTWDFGDGTTGAGATVSHTYVAAGLYHASVLASDGTASAATGLSVGVNSVTSGVEPIPFQVQKAMLKLNLKATQKDSLVLTGVLPVKSFSPANKTVQTVVGNLNRTFNLNSRGSGGDATNALKLSGKLKDGVFATSSVKFTLTLKKQTLSTSLQQFVFPGAQSNSILNIPVVISNGQRLGSRFRKVRLQSADGCDCYDLGAVSAKLFTGELITYCVHFLRVNRPSGLAETLFIAATKMTRCRSVSQYAV